MRSGTQEVAGCPVALVVSGLLSADRHGAAVVSDCASADCQVVPEPSLDGRAWA
ncbi:hypothetical protein GCM10027089_14170 [Nocardia thraciensis]